MYILSSIDAWQCKAYLGSFGRGFKYFEASIDTAFMIKGCFSFHLYFKDLIYSIFNLMEAPQISFDYTGLKFFAQGT
ncbi:hypothetical protein VCRA2113O23_70034 [Vibrio crassostreae]|nr:hypothetical protein VCRA2113O23_70034 [Vibrio crassostreae]